jgi:hypothetical protein
VQQPEGVAQGIAGWRRLASSLKPEMRLALAAFNSDHDSQKFCVAGTDRDDPDDGS